MKRCVFGLLVFLATACGGNDTPVAPTPPPPPPTPTIPACQATHTAVASFRNNGSKTIDILLDGGVIGTLNPGVQGLGQTVAANVAHNVQFRITNTNTFPCGPFNPIPVECSTPVYGSCVF